MEHLNNISNEYINELNNKHQEMRQCIRDNLKNKQLLKGGAYNKLFKIGDGVVIRQVDEGKRTLNKLEAKNSTFNNMFVPSLLKECGEDTITTGHLKFQNEEMLYMEEAEGSLMDKFIQCYKLVDWPGAERLISDFDKSNMSDDLIQTTLLTMILECFTTANFTNLGSRRFNMRYVSKINPEALKKFLSKDNMKVIARHLCKVFLFQMCDRKPENLLVKKDKTGKNLFVEADFDDIEEITCLFAHIKLDDNTKRLWQNNLDIIWQMYNFFINKIKDSGKIEAWNTIFKDTIKEYTITEEKIKNIICDIVIKNEYFGLNNKELIEGIGGKLELWTEMLNAAISDDTTSECFSQFTEAMRSTREALQKFDMGRIVSIVKQAQDQRSQALSSVYKNNTSADCNLRDYIPNWMKTCCGFCQGG